MGLGLCGAFFVSDRQRTKFGLTIQPLNRNQTYLQFQGTISRARIFSEDGKLRMVTVMTTADFWFMFGAASISAMVIGWVCFLEISYRLERQRHRAPLAGLAGLKTAGAAREDVPQPPTAAYRLQEHIPNARVDSEGKMKIAHAPVEVTSFKSYQVSETEHAQTAQRICA
jgi:hypothetical protein